MTEDRIEYVENKCYKCEGRKLGCHSTCEDYKKYKEYLEKIRAKERLGIIYREYQCENHERFLKKHKNYRGKE